MLTWAKSSGTSASLGERAILGFDTKRKKLSVGMELKLPKAKPEFECFGPKMRLVETPFRYL